MSKMFTAEDARALAQKIYNSKVKSEQIKCFEYCLAEIEGAASDGVFEITLYTGEMRGIFPQIFKYIEDVIIDLSNIPYNYKIGVRRINNTPTGQITDFTIKF
jgi:hypothetical protein